MKLSSCKSGDTVRVVDVNAPIMLRRRIFELGCTPKSIISVLAAERKLSGGIYAVKGVMLGIRADLSNFILVEKA